MRCHPLFCILIHSRTYGSQFTGTMPAALSEKNTAILTGQSHIFEVEDDSAVCHFRGDERFQLRNVFPVDLAAYGEDDFPILRPANS